MLPILNSMTIVGLVSFPGFMTGRLSTGADPVESSALQFMVMCSICLSIFIGSLLGAKMQKKYFFTKEGHFRILYETVS